MSVPSPVRPTVPPSRAPRERVPNPPGAGRVRRGWLLSVALLAAEPAAAAAVQHVVNPRFGFSVDLPAGLIAEAPPENGDGQAFHASDGSLRVTVSGIGNALDDDLRTFVASDRARCPRQPPDYLLERPDQVVFSCRAGGVLLYQKTILSGRGIDAIFVSLRIRYRADAQARWREAVVRASHTLRLIGAEERSR